MSEETKLKRVCEADGCDNATEALSGFYCKKHNTRLRRTGKLELKTTLEKLLERVEQTSTGCWLYTRYKNNGGYGRLRYKGTKILASRLSWTLHNGEIPSGIVVCHKCDNPSCVNPEHLFLGTTKDNVRDCINKGRFRGWQNSPFIKK